MQYKKERTLVIIKPDGVQRSLISEITRRFEQVGLKLVGLKMVIPTKEHIEKHYTLDPGWRMSVGTKSIAGHKNKGNTPPTEDPMKMSEIILGRLQRYMSSGPIVVMAWQGAHAAAIVRKLIGSTEPFSSDVGTIRGDFMLDSYELAESGDRSIRNVVHASGSADEAKQELKHWFDDNELHDYTLVQEQILYDVNLDGKKE